MIIQAELKCKQTGCEADPCAVDKVIELPSPRFRQFSRALLADYDFIAENKDAIQRDEDARHCLLILDAEGTDGFLIDPQGYNYARYSAFVPNARSLLTPDMGIDRSYLSPAEPWRNENRDEIEESAEAARSGRLGGCYSPRLRWDHPTGGRVCRPANGAGCLQRFYGIREGYAFP